MKTLLKPWRLKSNEYISIDMYYLETIDNVLVANIFHNNKTNYCDVIFFAEDVSKHYMPEDHNPSLLMDIVNSMFLKKDYIFATNEQLLLL